MLERASASAAECTTHLLLRSFDKPFRSQRRLGLAFWKHGGDQLGVPAWWPIYLQSIKQSFDSYNVYPELRPIAKTKSLLAKPGQRANDNELSSVNKSRQHRVCQSRATRARCFTAAASASGQLELRNSATDSSHLMESTSGQNLPVDYEGKYQKTGSVANSLPSLTDSTSPSVISGASHTHPATSVDYKQAWALFVQSGHKQESLSSMLRLMAQSSDRIDLFNALTAFDLLPAEQRTQVDFQVAIDVAVKLKLYKKAITRITQSITVGFGDNAYFKFMAFCVQHKLWNTLAALWKAVGPIGRRQIKSRQAQTKSKSPNMAGQYCVHFDRITDFSAKLVSLSTRLANTDAVLARNREDLVQVCKRLSYIAAESPKVMATINIKEALALFNIQQQLKFDSKLHLAAIGAISKMSERGALAQLTILIYRNLCFRHPELEIPRWVFGAMIGICANGRVPSSTYEYLLASIKHHYGQIDAWSYQQVLAACARQGDAISVQRIFEDYLRVERPKDLRDVHHLLHVHAVVGDAEQTQIQFDRLKQEFGFRPNVVSWTILLLAFARSADPKRAYEIYRKMRRHYVTPNSTTWAILISVAAKQGDINKAQRYYRRAEQEKSADSLYMIGPIVDCLLLNDKIQDAERLVMKTSGRRHKESPVRLWNSLFRYYAFKSDTLSISRIQNAMQNMNIQPDGMTYGALMTALVVKGQTKNAEKLLRRLRTDRLLHLTEFHYSILVHGYAMEKNRDSAAMIYNEMLERFPHASPSAKLAMLRLQLGRDKHKLAIKMRHILHRPDVTHEEQIKQIPSHGIKHLARYLVEDPRIDIASSMPNPGFGRRSARDGLHAFYFGSLISYLQTSLAHEPSKALVESALASFEPSPLVKITNITYQMNVAMQQQDWEQVDLLWHAMLRQSLQNLGVQQQSEAEIRQPKAHGIAVLSAEERTFTPMLSQAKKGDRATNRRILPAHRFALSWPFSMYLQALGYQGRYSAIRDSVQLFQHIGFSLSSRNWNRYIQVLSKSPEVEDQISAFENFEIYLFHDSLHWNVIRRGKYIAQAHGSMDKVMGTHQLSLRRRLERSAPHLLMPTYFTMIHLAAVVTKAFTAMKAGESVRMNMLQNRAPKTLALVQKVPRLADRAQGLLLRNRKVIGDRVARPRSYNGPLAGDGEEGSRSRLEDLPLATLHKFHELVTNSEVFDSSRYIPSTVAQQPAALKSHRMRILEQLRYEETRSNNYNRNASPQTGPNPPGDSGKQQPRPQPDEMLKVQSLLDLAEEAFGIISLGQQQLAAQGRKESLIEVENRILRQRMEYLDAMDNIQQEISSASSSPGDVHNHYIGAPIPPITHASKVAHNRKYDELLALIGNTDEGRKPASGKAQAEHLTVTFFPPNIAHGEPKSFPLPSSAHKPLPASHGIALKRCIAPRYKDHLEIPPLLPRRRGAWSINKANRLRRLREKQRYERWNKKVQKETEVHPKHRKTTSFAIPRSNKSFV